jgi:hypothetical protein
MVAMVSRLDIRVRRATPEPVAGDPEVVLLVDGVDVLVDAWGEGVGRTPTSMLGPDSPLLPDPAHDAPLLRCSCGDEGCGALVARIRAEADAVIWDQFRDGAASKSDRLSNVYDRVGGQPLTAISEIRFDRAQYLAELRRADEDRTWETGEERTARFVAQLLRDNASRLERTGWRLMWAGIGAPDLKTPFPHEIVPGVSVSLRSGARQITLSYPVSVTSPDHDAAAIADALLDATPSDWPVSFRGGVLDAWNEHPDL